jgi:nucleoside-diphosphate-sugar epimerase
VDAGHEVVALARNVDKAKDLADLGVELYKGDLTDKESMREPMTGVDGIYHIAGWYKVGVRDKKPGYAINVQGTRNVLELMQELKISKGVYTSTLADKQSSYMKKKRNFFMRNPVFFPKKSFRLKMKFFVQLLNLVDYRV